MIHNVEWLEQHSAASLRRLLPRVEARFKAQTDAVEWDVYVARLKLHFPRLFEYLHALYGEHYDFFYHMESILASATSMWLERPTELKALDALWEADPEWYQSNRMVGAMCYVDRFANNLEGLREHIPYLSEMGITYLHLMPLFKVPEGDNDGGYAVSSYREVAPELGTVLSRLTVYAKSDVDDVIDHDLILLWSDEKRVITGADILGQLLRGIALRDAR